HITHHEGRSTRQARPAMTVALWRSRLRYYDRYYPAWQRRAARTLIGLGMRAQIRRAQREHAAGRLTASAYQAHIEACREVLALL
ncbi:MAG: hypothetical protein N2383_15740, partial [Caldilineales bacterium]|nr:hypothetical protein [Caldilineales bacterium]